MLDNRTRDALIVKRYKAGETQELLAIAFHISRARVQQILKKHGVGFKDSPNRRNLYAFAGTHLTKDVKAQLTAEAKRSGKSISKLLSEAIEKKLVEAVAERKAKRG